MRLLTRTRNILRLFDYHTWAAFENIELCYKSSEKVETISERRFIDDLKWHGDSILFKYENEGRGYITLYGECEYLPYEYRVRVFVKECLRNYESVINILRYAVIGNHVKLSNN